MKGTVRKMKALFKKITTSIVTAVLMLLPAATVMPAVAHAQDADAICQGVLNDPSATADMCEEGSGGGETFASLSIKIINIFSVVVGTVSVIMIIIGGFRYIISGGSGDGVKGGKDTILYAIIGLVIVLFAQVIVRFVLTNVTKSS